jgi:site-specific recombinase XerD
MQANMTSDAITEVVDKMFKAAEATDAVQRLVTKHVATARASCPSIKSKRISTHNLRHSCAMNSRAA